MNKTKRHSNPDYITLYFASAIGIVGVTFWIAFAIYMILWVRGLDKISKENILSHAKYIVAFTTLLILMAFTFLSPAKILAKLLGVKKEIAKNVKAISGILISLLAIIYHLLSPKSVAEKIIEKGIYFETRTAIDIYISRKLNMIYTTGEKNVIIFKPAIELGELKLVPTQEEIQRGDIPDINTVMAISQPSRYEVILCHAGFTWVYYRSDRFGFRNPDEVWDQETSPENTAIIFGGDFAHGVCADDGKTIADILREKTGKTIINLAEKGDSPIVALAKLVEFGKIKKAENIILMFSGKDLMKIKDDWKHRILRQYINDANFSQSITKIKDKVDRTITAKIEPEMLAIEKSYFGERKKSLLDTLLEKIGINIAQTQDVSSCATPTEIFVSTIENKFTDLTSILFKPYSITEFMKKLYRDPKPDDLTLALFQITIKRIKEEAGIENKDSKITFVYLPDSFSVFRKFRYGKNKFFSILRDMKVDVIDVEDLLSDEEKRKLFMVDMADFYTEDGQRKVAEVLKNIF